MPPLTFRRPAARCAGAARRLALAPCAAAAVAAPMLAVPTLAAQVPQRLDTVRVVVGSRAADSVASFRTVEVLGRAELERLPALTLADVLARALGVEVPSRSPASADLSIRGSSFEQVLVLVDGVRVSDAQTGHFDLDLAVPLAAVERVEVLRGTGSATYGSDAVGGVVNVVTRRGTAGTAGTAGADGAVRAGLHAGSFGTAGGTLAAQRDVRAVQVSASADFQRSDGHRPGTDYELLQARLGGARALRRGTLSADAGVGVRAFGAADFYGPYPSHERTTSATGSMRWSGPVGAGWSVSSVASTRRHGDRFTLRRAEPSFYRNVHTSWQTGAELVARRTTSAATSVAVGGEAYDLRLASRALGDRRERRLAAFAEAATDPAARLGANAGLRVDWSSEFDHVLSPSLAGRWTIRDGVAVRASASRGHRAPTWTERFYRDPANEGDPALRPERFWTGEIGVRAAPARRLRVDAATFVRRAEGLIDWARPADASSDVPWRTRNVERATFVGAELRADLLDALGAEWTLRASTIDVDAADAAGYAGKYALRPLTRSVSLAAQRPLGRALSLAVEAGVAGHAGEAPFVRGDARLSYQWSRARLTLDAVNLTDADYLDASARPVAGRALFLGVHWR